MIVVFENLFHGVNFLTIDLKLSSAYDKMNLNKVCPEKNWPTKNEKMQEQT